MRLPEFNTSQLESFHALVRAVTEPPVLALPKDVLPYSVDADASAAQIGGGLFQTYEGGERKPLGFWSRRINYAERNHTVSEKEYLAVIHMLSACRHYLLGQIFDIYTDHACLSWLMKIVDPATRLVRWRLRLAEYRFNIRHRNGAKH